MPLASSSACEVLSLMNSQNSPSDLKVPAPTSFWNRADCAASNIDMPCFLAKMPSFSVVAAPMSRLGVLTTLRKALSSSWFRISLK